MDWAIGNYMSKIFGRLAEVKEKAEFSLFGKAMQMRSAAEKMTTPIADENSTKLEKAMDKLTIGAVTAATGVAVVTPQNAYAVGSIGKAVRTIAKSFYNEIDATITYLLAAVVGFCFFMMVFSKDERKAAAWSEWMKRAALGWLGFKFISLFIDYGEEIVKDSGATNTPWGAE